MTNGFRDSYGEHSHKKTRPVINVSLITLTFLQVDFHTYPIILACLCSCLQTAVMCCCLISPVVMMLLSISVIVYLKCPESWNIKGLVHANYKKILFSHFTSVVCSHIFRDLCLHPNAVVVNATSFLLFAAFKKETAICSRIMLRITVLHRYLPEIRQFSPWSTHKICYGKNVKLGSLL